MSRLCFSFQNVYKYRYNGYILNGIYLPQEIILEILSYIEVEFVLKYTLIKCRKLDRKIQNDLPWCGYYCLARCDDYLDKNLIKNPNAEFDIEEGWKTQGEWNTENIEPLEDQINGFDYKYCFSGMHDCERVQNFSFAENKLLTKIFNRLHPMIYFSEWFSCRVEGECYYKMYIELSDTTCVKENVIKQIRHEYKKNEGGEWRKVEAFLTAHGSNTHMIYGNVICDLKYRRRVNICRITGTEIRILSQTLNFHVLDALIRKETKLTVAEKIKFIFLPRCLTKRK